MSTMNDVLTFTEKMREHFPEIWKEMVNATPEQVAAIRQEVGHWDLTSTVRVVMTWHPDDVKTLRPNWTNARCAAVLEEVNAPFQLRVTEEAWQVLEDLLPLQTAGDASVVLTETDNSLEIRLTAAGRVLLDEIYASTADLLTELLDWHTRNGWSWIEPQDIGALTSAPILGRGVQIDDGGEFVAAEAIYWHERYAIDNPITKLIEDGVLIFDKAKE